MLIEKIIVPIDEDRLMGENCQNYSVDLSAFFDDELEGDELKAVEDHLQSCENCQAEIGKMKKLHDALVDVSVKPVKNKSLLQEIMAKLDKEEDREDEEGKGNILS